MAPKSIVRTRLALKLALSLTLITLTATSISGQHTTTTDSELLRTPAQWERAYQCSFVGHNASALASEQQPDGGPGGPIELAAGVAWWQWAWFKIMHVCNRDSSAWRFLYLDEILSERGFTPRILERSPNERLSNIIYAISLNTLADLSYFKFNSGDPQRDEENARLVAGPLVSEEQCDEDLGEMAAQFDELQQLMGRLRAGDSGARLEAHHLRLVRALDTYGRYEAAMLTGQTKLMGAYSQCDISLLERHFHRKSRQQVNELPMRYCWAKLDMEPHVSEQLLRRRRLGHESSETSLQVGVCLPRACHTRTLSKHKQSVQKFVNSQLQLPSTIYVNQSLDLESVFCLVDPESEFRMPLSGKVFLAFAVLWLAACCVATLLRLGETRAGQQADELEKSALEAGKLAGGLPAVLSRAQRSLERRPRAALRLLSHLNLRNSWNDFTADKRQISATARVDLDVLNPVKLLACAFCVASHAILLLGTVAGHQGEAAAFVERDYIIQSALIASTIVDTFFVISGILLTYIMLKKLTAGFGVGMGARAHQAAPAASSAGGRHSEPSAWLAAPRNLSNFLANWLLLSLNRYLRLLPLYALMFWFRRDVLTYLGSGPMWDYGFNRNTMNGACSHESSLMPFTPLSAFVPLNKQCYVPSWSVSNDILFALVLPPIILLLHHRPRVGLSVALTLMGAAVANSLRGYLEAEPQNRWELGEFRLHGVILLFTGLSDLYTSPFYRASSYLVGTLAGYFLFKYDQKSAPKQARWPVWLTRLVTPISITYLLLHTVLSVQAMQAKALLYPYQRLVVAFMVTLDRPLWACANAALFLRMVTDWRLWPSMQACARQTWRTLARLNFAMLFTHWIFVVIQTNTIMALPTFTGWQIYAQVASIYLASLPAALLVHVVFENPIDNLIKRELFGL